MYSNIKISPIYSLSLVRKHINKRITDLTIENIINRYTEIENTKYVSNKKTNENIQTIIKLSDNIINTNKSQLNLLNKNQINLNFSKPNNFKFSNNELLKRNLKYSNLNYMNEQQYIKLISPFNSKLTSFNNHIYTFTNKPYKQINKNLNNLYIICKSVFLNMSSIISKPIVSINPNLLKITLFYY
jgi:hypothetical protein